MKNIVLFIDNLGSGGAQRRLVNIALLLKNRGYQVSMLVYSDFPFYQNLLEENHISVKLLHATNPVARMLRVRKYLRKYGADAVIAFLETPGFIACFSKMGGAKWKLITNESSAKASTFQSRKNRFFNWFERYSDAKVCNSINAMTMWESHYPQYKNKYAVIYNPVIIPEEYLCGKKQIRDDQKVHIVVAASYQKLKNPLRVIEAIAKLDDTYQNKLDLQWYGRAEVTTGDTAIYDKAVQMVKEYGLEHCITLNQETKEIYDIMRNSDAVGLFSEVEGLPNAICEGMMLGKPIVMSKVSDYQVLTEGNGFCCDPYSVDDIKNTLIRLLDATAAEMEEMGRVSREKAERLFAKDVVIEQWIDLLEQPIKK